MAGGTRGKSSSAGGRNGGWEIAAERRCGGWWWTVRAHLGPRTIINLGTIKANGGNGGIAGLTSGNVEQGRRRRAAGVDLTLPTRNSPTHRLHHCGSWNAGNGGAGNSGGAAGASGTRWNLRTVWKWNRMKLGVTE